MTNSALMYNALYSLIWAVTWLCYLRTEKKQYLTQGDWHNMMSPALLLLASLVSYCLLYSVKDEGIVPFVESKMKVAKMICQAVFIFIVSVGLWVQIEIIS